VTTKYTVFWDVAPCRSCVNRRLRAKYRLHLQGRKIRERGTSVSRWQPHDEDGGDTFLRNVGSYKIYMAPNPRRRYSSYLMHHGSSVFLSIQIPTANLISTNWRIWYSKRTQVYRFWLLSEKLESWPRPVVTWHKNFTVFFSPTWKIRQSLPSISLQSIIYYHSIWPSAVKKQK
jgi:hypothetical protein